MSRRSGAARERAVLDVEHHGLELRLGRRGRGGQETREHVEKEAVLRPGRAPGLHALRAVGRRSERLLRTRLNLWRGLGVRQQLAG